MEQNKIRNKILAISGQPVTGKGTNIKAIIEKLKQMGYAEENIHLESTGNEFRKYFNIIVELIQSLDNEENVKKLTESEELKKIFSNNEYRKAFTETLAMLKKSGLDLSKFNIEQANNLEEFKKIRKIVDTLIDEGIKEKGIEINSQSRPDDIWIIDSRLAFYNIPDAFSVRLTASPDVAAQRLLQDKTRGKEDSKYKDIVEAKEARERRRIGETSRYLQRYGVNLEDENNYDLIIDTSYSSINDISNTILKCSELFYQGKPFEKKWTSPKLLLPLQEERLTYGKALYDLEEIIQSIRENGYYPSSPVEIVEADGLKGIVEGHHRNFGAAYDGLTLVPYIVLAKDDEKLPGKTITARQYMQGLTASKLYGHEELIGKEFSYKEVYPDIYEKLKQKEQEER